MPRFTRTLPLVLTAALMAGQAAAPVRAMDLNAGLTLSPKTGSPDSDGMGRSAGALQSRLAFDDDTLALSGRLPWRVGDGSAEGTGGSLTELQAGGGGRIVVGVLQGLRQAEGQSWLSYAGIEMSLDTYSVRRKGHEIRLGPIEFRILRHLLQNPGKVFSRTDLIGAAWPENIHVEERTVDVHIGRLRKSLNSVSGADVIRTVRSAGYALVVEPEEVTTS